MGEAQTGHSPVVEDILKIIWSAQERSGDGVSVNEVAARMGVVPSTASENVARLTEQGLVDHKPYRKAHLTAEGRRVAIGIVRRHRLLETYLHEALGFDWDEVHEEAEALEHAVSDRLLERLDRVLGHPSRDPHGDPIPRPDGSVADEAGVLLPLVGEGAGCVVARVSDRDPQALREFDAAGLVPGAALTVVRKEGSAVVVALGGAPTVHLGAEQAGAITVRLAGAD